MCPNPNGSKDAQREKEREKGLTHANTEREREREIANPKNPRSSHHRRDRQTRDRRTQKTKDCQTWDRRTANPRIASRTAPIAPTSHTANPQIASHTSVIAPQFDRIWWFFFFGFVSFVSWTEKWYYIFVWKMRKCEKIWATSRKCVFYSIFKNTTKYQKIFFKAFFEMQPNTWKYFPFLKIAYFPENILHEPNTA